MKRIIYIVLFTFLGALVSTILHGLVELWYIGLLNADFATYGLGWSWETWFMIHAVGSWVLLTAGIAFGFQQGVYWWRVLYGEGQLTRWRFHGR